MSRTATSLGLSPTSTFFSLSNPQVPLLAIPAAWILAFAPHFTKVVLLGSNYDNTDPRRGVDLDAATRGMSAQEGKKFRARISRLAGQHANGTENFPLFAATVLLALHTPLPTSHLSLFTLVYLSSRLVHTAAYVLSAPGDAGLASLRTGSYFVGMLGCVWVGVKSALSVATF